MKLKHYGLLALLGVLSWSCAEDNGIKMNVVSDKETRKAKKEFYQKRQKWIVAGTVVITIGILFFCKHSHFFEKEGSSIDRFQHL